MCVIWIISACVIESAAVDAPPPTHPHILLSVILSFILALFHFPFHFPSLCPPPPSVIVRHTGSSNPHTMIALIPPMRLRAGQGAAHTETWASCLQNGCPNPPTTLLTS